MRYDALAFYHVAEQKTLNKESASGSKSGQTTTHLFIISLHCIARMLQPTVNTEHNERSRFGHECFVMLVLKWLIKVYHKIGDAIQYKTATTTTMVAGYSIGLALPELGSLGLGLAWI